MIKGMKKFTALLLTAVMIVSVIVNSDIMTNYAFGEKTNAKASIAVDSTLFESHGIEIHIKTTPEDDFDSSWNYDQRPASIDGGIYVDGTLNTSCVLIKLPDRYIIGLYDAGYHTAEDLSEGMTVVLDGIYGRCGIDTKFGDGYMVKFNPTTFEYTKDGWKQLYETDVVPSVKMDSSLIDGDRNCIQVWPSQVDDFTFTSDWVDRPVRIAGGVYVDGKLNTGCTLIRFSNFYYIALSDGQVDVEEGTTVVFDGIYGRCSNDPKYGDNYTVKFNKSTFEYTNGSWIQK